MKKNIIILILFCIGIAAFGDDPFFENGSSMLLPQLNVFSGDVYDGSGNSYPFYSNDLKNIIAEDKEALKYYKAAVIDNQQASILKGIGLGLDVVSVLFIVLAAQDYQTFVSDPLLIFQKPEGISGVSGFVIGTAVYLWGSSIGMDANNNLLKSITLYNRR